MHNLVYTARSLDCHPQYELLLLFFFLGGVLSWVEGLLVLDCRPLSAANRVSNSKMSVSNPFYLLLTVP